MKWTSLVIVAVALMLRAETVHACSCGAPQIEISPSGADAPTNATVVVWVPDYLTRGSDLILSLRKKASGEILTVDFRKLGAASVTVMEMLPKAKLTPNTEYEVVQLDGDVSRVVGSFTTGMREVTGTPAWKGVAKASYFKAVPVCCACMTADPYAELELADKPGKDAASYRVGIWMAGGDGKIDYRKPPVTYESLTATLWLGHPSTCGPANFSFPRSRRLKLGLRLVDLAGHASAPSEVELDTTRPIKPPAS